MKFKLLTLLAALLCAAGCDWFDKPEPEKEPYFNATINDVYLQGPDDTGFSIVVDTNMADSLWTVEADVDWLQTGKSATTVTVIPSGYDPRREDNGASIYAAPRTGSVTVRAGSVFNKTFTVVQESMTFINSEYEVKMAPSGDSTSVFVRHNCYSWTATTEASWITLKKFDSSTLIITTSARGTNDPAKRSATVLIQSDRDTQTFCNITVSDADSNLGGEDYKYGDHTNWD